LRVGDQAARPFSPLANSSRFPALPFVTFSGPSSASSIIPPPRQPCLHGERHRLHALLLWAPPRETRSPAGATAAIGEQPGHSVHHRTDFHTCRPAPVRARSQRGARSYPVATRQRHGRAWAPRSPPRRQRLLEALRLFCWPPATFEREPGRRGIASHLAFPAAEENLDPISLLGFSIQTDL